MVLSKDMGGAPQRLTTLSISTQNQATADRKEGFPSDVMQQQREASETSVETRGHHVGRNKRFCLVFSDQRSSMLTIYDIRL